MDGGKRVCNTYTSAVPMFKLKGIYQKAIEKKSKLNDKKECKLHKIQTEKKKHMPKQLKTSTLHVNFKQISLPSTLNIL